MDNIPLFPPAEVVYTNEVGESGKPRKLRPYQKSVAVTTTLMAHHSAPGSIVLDLFCAPLAVAKTALLLPRHRHCVCGDTDWDCVKVFAQKLFNEDSELTAGEKVQAAAALLCSFLKAIWFRKKTDVWGTLGVLPPV